MKKSEVVKEIVSMCRELDTEMDGVRVPAAAAAILNRIRSLLQELDDE